MAAERDTGGPDARLAQALREDLSSPAGRAAVLAALAEARVFAAVTATATGEESAAATGLRAESGAELAVVLLAAQDGTRALPVFSDLLALRAWRADVRPVPLSGTEACGAAVEQGADAVVLNPAGPLFALDRQEVRSLSAGWTPVPGADLDLRRAGADAELRAPEPGEVPDGLAAALRTALEGEELAAARLLAGPTGLVLGVAPRRALGPADLAALAARVRARLGPRLPPDGLGLTVVPAEGPGLGLVRRRGFRRRGR